MKKSILYIGKILNKKEQQEVKGGYYPTPKQYCCTRTKSFWLDLYPTISGNPRYNCTSLTTICNYDDTAI